ncbi:MAG: DUF6163 family protein [Pseudomonadota bacterium]
MNQKVTGPRTISSDQAIHLAKAKPTGAAARLEWVMHAYLRVISLFFLALSIWVWASAVGFEGTGSAPFTTMARPQQIYTTIGAVLFPVVSVGLWSTLSWGRVVWALAIVFQVVGGLVYGVAPLLNDGLLLFHGTTIGLYLVLAAATLLRPNKPRR